MSRHTLYLLVDGSDLHAIAPRLRELLEALVLGRAWSRPTSLVDQQHEPDGSMGAVDLCDWDMGVVHDLPDDCGGDWFDDVSHLAQQVDRVAAELGREFAVGLADNDRGIAEDIGYLDGGGVDLERLRQHLGGPAGGRC